MNGKVNKFSAGLCLVISLAASSCKTPVLLSHGTSFGHCAGYCHQQITLSEKEVTYAQRKNGAQPDIRKCVQPLSSGTRSQLMALFNEKAFNQLDSVIGCPDCADGGAEWVEVKKGNHTKRVTFEYRHAPEQLSGLVAEMKKLQDGMEGCQPVNGR